MIPARRHCVLWPVEIFGRSQSSFLPLQGPIAQEDCCGANDPGGETFRRVLAAAERLSRVRVAGSLCEAFEHQAMMCPHLAHRAAQEVRQPESFFCPRCSTMLGVLPRNAPQLRDLSLDPRNTAGDDT